MKRLLVVMTVTAIACRGGNIERPHFDGQAALGYVEQQLAFGPRIPNTVGHQRTGDWILEQLRQRADSVLEQAFTHVAQNGDTLRLRNFIGKFRPEIVDRVLYVVHWDTRPHADRALNVGEQRLPVPGANDGASGVALLLAVADALQLAPPVFGVDLVFVDGEDYGDFATRDDVLIGSRHYADRMDPSQLPLFAVVWDMIGDRDLTLYQEGYSVSRAPEVVGRVWSLAAELGYGSVFRPTVGTAVIDDHVPLQDVGVRAIDVIDFEFGPNNAYWHTLEDTIDKVSAESLQIVGEVAVGLVR